MKNEVVVFEKNFGQETEGEVRLNLDTKKYQVYITPPYGGYFDDIGGEHDTLEDAKVFLFAEFA